MNRFFDKFLNNSISFEERLFYIVSSMSSVLGLLFVLIGVFVRVKPSALIVFLAYSLVAFILFIFETRKHKTNLYTIILLVLLSYLVFPFLMVSSTHNSPEVIVYFLIGITCGIVMLTGRTRIIYLIGQLIVDIGSMYYTFVLRQPYYHYYMNISRAEKFRLVYAIFSTGLFLGTVILYRNGRIRDEISERESAGKQAEKVSFAKDMFLVNVSHEIRTPLNAIIGTTDVLLESDVSNHIKENAFNISNSSHALLAITNDLLDFSRMNVDSISITNQKYDISVLLNDVINLMSVRLLDSSVSFFVDINPLLPKVLYGDSNKLRQILVNFLSNATKYTEKGSMTLVVDFEYTGDNELLLDIKVQDTGIGIKPENIDKIFEPLNRSGSAETDHKFEGNGLGLAFCKSIAKAMDGEIKVKSVYGEGSEFSFSVKQSFEDDYKDGYCGELKTLEHNILIYIDEKDETHNLSSVLSDMSVRFEEVSNSDEFISKCKNPSFDYCVLSAESYEKLKAYLISENINWSKIVVLSSCNYSYSGEPFELVLTKPVSCLNLSDLLNQTVCYSVRKQLFEGEFSLPDTTILIVDDNLVNLEVASNIMSRFNARILTAASGREGIICLNQEKVDIVFLDYMMPDMDGIDTLKEIRKINNGQFEKLPVVTLTANVVSGAKEMFMNAGFDGYLSKPLEVDKLSKILMELLPGDCIKYSVK